jgi:hypothetical protein
MAEARREGVNHGRFLNTPAEMVHLATHQKAVFAIWQLKATGVRARTIQRRAGSHILYRLYHGVYALVPPHLLTREGRYMAAVLACGPGAVLSLTAPPRTSTTCATPTALGST